MPKPKPYNSGQWTEARFRSFVMSALRGASMKWGPKNECKKAARISRGMYLCAHCKSVVPNSTKKNGKRVNNAIVDHINPIVPVTGFDSWDNLISRLLCEVDGLQLLCKACHDVKTKAENEERKRLTKL